MKTNSNPTLFIELLSQIQPIDFKELAFPQYKTLKSRLNKIDADSEVANVIRSQMEQFRLNQKHYLILTIENINKIAKENNWGLSKKHDFIYIYNGQYWENVDKDLFQRFLGLAALKMGVPKFNAKHYDFKEKLYKQFLSDAYLPISETSTEKVLINLGNGTFEISEKGNKLRDFNKKDFLTYQLSFNYDKTASAPIFRAYLDKVLPHKDLQLILAEYMGFIFLKNDSKALKEEKALILFGGGANGKSVFFEIVNALLGSENISNYSLFNLTNNNGYHRAKLANKLVNYSSEINEKLEVATFKQLVSGEPIECRLPYGEPFILREYAKLIFNTNVLPADVEQTAAFYRRFLIIPFNVTIPEHEQDKELHNKIIENELSGVFNWILEGLHRLLAQKGFTYSDIVNETIETYKTQSDSVKLFLQENSYIASNKTFIKLKDLYFEYRSFCLDDGYKPVNKNNFIKRLINTKIIIEKKNVGNVAFLQINMSS